VSDNSEVETMLRTVRPLKVVAVLDDDREVPLAIPRGTRRWERLAATIASQPWVELRALDKSGALMAAPLVRSTAAVAVAQPAEQLEDVTGTARDRQVDAVLVERLLRMQTETLVRGFTEVVKVARASGAAEVTAALQANRETLAAINGLAADLRDQLDQERGRVRELEAELAERLALEPPPQTEQPKSAVESLVEHFAGGFVAGAGDAPKNGHNKAQPAG
jgi:hypothetical protein